MQELQLSIPSGQTLSQYSRAMRLEMRSRTLRLRLVILAAFSAASLPLFFIGGTAGLITAGPYLITDCTNVRIFLFLRVQRARLTMVLASLTAALVFILAPLFLVAAYVDLGLYEAPNPSLPPPPGAPSAPPPGTASGVALGRILSEESESSEADFIHFDNIKSAFAASAIDYLGLGILSVLVACSARDLIQEAQPPSPPRVPGRSVVVRRDRSTGEVPNCSICLDEIQRNQPARELPCHHTFHRDCIGPWLQVRNSCPECRAPVV